MKVSGKTSGVSSAPSVAGGKPSGSIQSAEIASSPAVQEDALSVSGDAHFIAAATARLASIPDIRTDKVEAIRAQMDSDAYNPDGLAVADGLIREYTPPASFNEAR